MWSENVFSIVWESSKFEKASNNSINDCTKRVTKLDSIQTKYDLLIKYE